MARRKIPFLNYKPKEVKEAVWISIVDGWENGLSDRQAAFRASKETGEVITQADITRWKKENPEIKELFYNLHDDLVTSAKMNVADAVKDGDTQTSKWYLERKATDEFSTKQAVAFEGAAIEVSLADKEKALKDMVEKFEADGE